MDLKLRFRKAFITGSTKGIGKALAKSLLMEGADVVVAGKSRIDTESTVYELKEFGNVNGVSFDLNDPNEISSVLHQIDRLGPIDILINNAATFEAQPFLSITDDDWLRYININLLSAVRLSRYFLPQMLKRNWGRIINIASEAAIKPLPSMIHYSVTKTALVGLSRAMSELTKGSNVTVNTVLPGPTWTEGSKRFIEREALGQNVDMPTMIKFYFDKVEPTSLLQRFATVDEIANVIAFLSSDLSSAINGSTQRVEGGIIRSI